MLDSYDFNPPQIAPPAGTPDIATNAYAPISDAEDEPYADTSYVPNTAGDTGRVELEITKFISGGASVGLPGTGLQARSSALATTGSRTVKDNNNQDWDQSVGVVDDFGSSYAQYTLGDSFSSQTPEPPTDLTEVIVIARRNDDDFTGFPGSRSNEVSPILVVAGGGGGKVSSPKVYLKTPAYLVGIGVLYIPPISPGSYAYIFRQHGPAGLAKLKTVFLNQYLNPATMNFLFAAAINGGQVVDIDARGYVAIVWTAPVQIGTNRQGDSISTVRVILQPIGNGTYAVMNMYPVGSRR